MDRQALEEWYSGAWSRWYYTIVAFTLHSARHPPPCPFSFLGLWEALTEIQAQTFSLHLTPMVRVWMRSLIGLQHVGPSRGGILFGNLNVSLHIQNLKNKSSVCWADMMSQSFVSGMIMIIAFITIKSSLVPLIEGLCAQIYFRFEISVFCSHLLLFFFVKEKTC